MKKDKRTHFTKFIKDFSELFQAKNTLDTNIIQELNIFENQINKP